MCCMYIHQFCNIIALNPFSLLWSHIEINVFGSQLNYFTLVNWNDFTYNVLFNPLINANRFQYWSDINIARRPLLLLLHNIFSFVDQTGKMLKDYRIVFLYNILFFVFFYIYYSTYFIFYFYSLDWLINLCPYKKYISNKQYKLAINYAQVYSDEINVLLYTCLFCNGACL